MSDARNILQQNFKSFKQFLQEQGPSNLMLNYNHVTIIANVFQNTKISLNAINGAFKDTTDAGYEYMHEWIKFLNEFLNIRNGLQHSMMQTLALNCYNKYGYFTLADLKLLLDFILESKYGTFYGSVDTQRILTSFSEYARERREFEDKLIQKEKERRKKEENEKRVGVYDPNKHPVVASLLNGSKRITK